MEVGELDACVKQASDLVARLELSLDRAAEVDGPGWERLQLAHNAAITSLRKLKEMAPAGYTPGSIRKDVVVGSQSEETVITQAHNRLLEALRDRERAMSHVGAWIHEIVITLRYLP